MDLNIEYYAAMKMVASKQIYRPCKTFVLKNKTGAIA